MRKERPILFSTDMVQAILEGRKIMTRRILKLKGYHIKPFPPDSTWTKEDIDRWTKDYCPYGQPGDILWVKETYGFFNASDDLPIEYRYKASDDKPEGLTGWKSGMFMPKAAARIFLEITDIRVEQLFKITREDAISEGCGNEGTDYPEGNFYALWRKINGIESYQSNPWVWVISFKVLSTTGRPHAILGPF